MQIVYSESLSIRTSDINPQLYAHPHALIQIMEEVSLQHTLTNKISFKDLSSVSSSWVLLKKEVEVFRFPQLNDIVTVTTYPSDIKGFFTYRDYHMSDISGEKLATISSMWTMMHTGSRKMMRIPDSYTEMLHRTADALTKPEFRIRSFEYPCFPQYTQVNYLHLDWNGHVNNAEFVKMIFGALPGAFHEQYRMHRLQIHYKREAQLGMELKICNYFLSETSIHHRITDKHSGLEIVLAQSEWNEL